MFDAVSVFQAPFLPAGAADALGVERTHALELLTALVERSLVHRAGDRYGVYESLRQLGAEHLAAAGTAAAVQERHARHHAAYAATARARVRVPGDGGILRELDALGGRPPRRRALVRRARHRRGAAALRPRPP